MSDRIRLLEALRQAGDSGLHTHDIRWGGISGNPSQRRIELLEEGHLVRVERERRNGRPGARFFLEHDAHAAAGPDPSPEPPPASSAALFEIKPRGFGDLEEVA